MIGHDDATPAAVTEEQARRVAVERAEQERQQLLDSLVRIDVNQRHRALPLMLVRALQCKHHDRMAATRTANSFTLSASPRGDWERLDYAGSPRNNDMKFEHDEGDFELLQDL